MQISVGLNVFRKEEVNRDLEFDEGSDPGFDVNSYDNENEIRSSKQSSCGIAPIAPNLDRIMGGHEAKPNSWPWQVSIVYNVPGRLISHFCGGTIISPSKVLTATHCVRQEKGKSVPNSFLSVYAGIHNLSESTGPTAQAREVVGRIEHPDYNRFSVEYDITILYVNRPFVFGEKVQAACLPSGEVPVGTVCVATGYGAVSYGIGNYEQTLRQVKLPINSEAECQSKWGSKFNNALRLCAGFPEGGKDICRRDSGGPLVCQLDGVWVIEGIASSGSICKEPTKPGVFTRVSLFVPWINEH